MANNNQISRRKFLDKFWTNENVNPINKSRFLNPINQFNQKILKELPAVEHEVLFLNRSSFGIRPSDYLHIKSIGIENYLEEQLDYESIDNSDLEDILDLVYPLVDFTLPEIIGYIEEGEAIGEDRSTDAAVQLISETMIRQLYSKHQLLEVMVEFWSNHFNIDIINDIDLILKVHEDKRIIRPNTFTSFREILHADSKSSAMMFYLDNYTNTKLGPNENYARELMELHTLGVNGGYTEEDVKEVARCFTGWSIGANDSGFFEFYENTHDTGEKNVLGQVISNQQGIKDGEQVIDILADSSITAGFIARKMIRRFCSDIPDIQLVRAVAKSYMSTDGDTKEMLRTIFHSRQFTDSVDKKFKRPIEFVTSVIRSIDIESKQTNTEQMFYPLGVLFNEYEINGQVPFFWSPPTGYPDVASYWTNVSAILRRINFSTGSALGNILYPLGDDELIYSDYYNYDLDEIIGDEVTAVGIISRIEDNVLFRKILPEDINILTEFLSSNGGNISNQRIRAVIGILLSSTYFQLR